MMKKTLLALLLLVSLLPLLASAEPIEGKPCTINSALGYSPDCECGQTCTLVDKNNPGLGYACYTTPGTGWYNPCKAKIESAWNFWGPLTGLGVFVAFLIAALAYMIGIGFDLQPMRMWAKSEVYQAFASAVLVGSLVLMCFIMLDDGMAVILGANINPFSVSQRYLESISGPLLGMYRSLYDWTYYPEGLISFYTYQNAAVVTSEQYFLAWLKPLIVDPQHLTMHFIVQILIMVYFQQAALSFFQQKMFSVVLPLGVFLRTFPVTRGAGGLVIAVAIGFFFVYPTVFAFVARMTEESGAMNAALDTSKASTVGVDFAQFSACSHDFESAAKTAEEQANPTVLATVNQYNSFLPPLFIKTFFFPMIIFAVVISFIRVAAPLLGADISEVGQGLVKLI